MWMLYKGGCWTEKNEIDWKRSDFMWNWKKEKIQTDSKQGIGVGKIKTSVI